MTCEGCVKVCHWVAPLVSHACSQFAICFDDHLPIYLGERDTIGLCDPLPGDLVWTDSLPIGLGDPLPIVIGLIWVAFTNWWIDWSLPPTRSHPFLIPFVWVKWCYRNMSLHFFNFISGLMPCVLLLWISALPSQVPNSIDAGLGICSYFRWGLCISPLKISFEWVFPRVFSLMENLWNAAYPVKGLVSSPTCNT